jgi:acyl carrier protein
MNILDSSKIDERIFKAIRKVKPSLESVPLTPSTRIRDLGLESIEVLTVVFEMEEEFNVSIVDQQLDTFRTVEEARAVVEKLLAKQGSPGTGAAAAS